jgi:hypothetical protein
VSAALDPTGVPVGLVFDDTGERITFGGRAEP